MPTLPTTNGYTLNPLVWIAGAFSIGIFLAAFLPLPLLYFVAGTVMSVSAAVIFRSHVVATPFVLIAFAALGAVCFQVEVGSVSQDRLKRLIDGGRIASGDPVETSGTVVGAPEPAPEGAFILLTVDEIRYRGDVIKASGRIRLFVNLRTEAAIQDLDAVGVGNGTRIVVAGTMVREVAFLNPGVIPRTQILDQQGIDATMSVKSPLLIEKLSDPSGLDPLGWVYEQRQSLIGTIRSTFKPQTAGILIAATLGNKYFLDRRTADLFREGGTFHVLVISGLHITFIGGMILLAVRRFSRKPSFQFGITICLLWAYAFAVGAESPVIRASLMFTAILFAYVIDRQVSPMNSLGLCVLLLLVWRPSDLFNPSFQLTVVSVAAIIGVALPLVSKLRAIGSWRPSAQEPLPPRAPRWLVRVCETLYWNRTGWDIELRAEVWSASLFKLPFFGGRLAGVARRAAAYCIEAMIVSLSVQICLLPLLIYYFHRLSPASVVLNIWVGILLATKSIFAAIALILGFVNTILAAPIVEIVELISRLMLEIPSLIVSLDAASWRIPVYSEGLRWAYMFYLLPVVTFGILLSKWQPFRRNQNDGRAKWLLAVSALVVMIYAGMLIVHPLSSPAVDGRLRIDFLDVGQGDAALVTFPNGETMLIDGGGIVNYGRMADDDFEPDIARVGEMVVSEFLWERGYSRIDHIVASHADADHTQGLIDVARNFKIGNAYFAATQVASDETAQLFEILNARGAATLGLRRGDRLSIGGAELEVLHPTANSTTANTTENNRSLGLMLSDGGRSFLFTGDIEEEAEAEILAAGGEITTDVVKVPHHGSRTSSTISLVSATKPLIAVIPVGRRSRFGHPHAEVVERWTLSGADLRTTGEKGTITVATDANGEMSVNTYK
ncbi:hypothetical protein BH24ACI3_BH24ACI3_03570 [soil metagenome]